MGNFQEKSRAAYNKIADDYNNSYEGKFTRAFHQMIAAHIALPAHANVLDVACGNGTLLKKLQKQFGIHGFGIDIAEQMVKNAKQNNPDMMFEVAGCEAIPFSDASMDAITVCAAYHHFPDVDAFAREANRVLKPGGKIYIGELFMPAPLRMLANPFMPLSKSGDYKLYAPKQIMKTFSQAGFASVECIRLKKMQLVIMQKGKN